MFKRLLIGLMCVGFMGSLVTEANAAWGSAGNVLWGWTNSVDCKALWKNIGNTERDPLEIECVILPIEIEARCKNPGGNIGGGIRFDVAGALIGSSNIVNPEDFILSDAKGKYLETDPILIHDDQIFSGLGQSYLDDKCDAFNGSDNDTSRWTAVSPDDDGFYVYVWKMFAAIRGWKDTDDDGVFETLIEDVQAACYAPEGSDLSQSGLYNCDELCDKTRRFDCPESLTNYLCVDVYDEYPLCETDGQMEYVDLIEEYFDF